MLCTAITLDEKSIDIIIGALVKKMGELNTKSLISGVKTEKMVQDYNDCEKTLDILTKAKENLG